MINLKQIQQRFIETIQQSDIKQTELAEKLNLTQSTIAHYIKGDILPALDTLANLCKIGRAHV